MTYQQAGRRAIINRIIGWVIFIPALFSTLISLISFAAQQVNDTTRGVGAVLADLMKLIVEMLRFNTPFLDFLWHSSPIPHFSQGMTSNNTMFFIIYFLIFVGMAFNEAGARLSRRVKYIREGVEDQLILERSKGEEGRSREQLEQNINLPSITIFSRYMTLYASPLLLILIGYLLFGELGWL